MKAFVETDCVVEHQGQRYSAGGTYMTQGHALVYIDGDRATTWNGEPLGRVTVVNRWRVPTRWQGWYTMAAVRVVMADGTKWCGRYNEDGGQACRLRRIYT